jgi:hypothetical protein
LHQDDLEEKMVSIVLHAFKRGSLSWEKNAAIGKVLLSFRSQGMAEEQIRRWLSRSMEPLLLFQEGKWHLGDNDETKLLMQLMGYNKKIAKWISNQMGLLAAQGPFELLCQLVALAPSDPQKRWWDMLAHPVILFQAFQRGDLQLDNHASEAQYLFQKLASNPHGRDVRERAFAWLEQQIQMAASQGNKDLVQKMIEISPSSLHLREKWQDFLEE